jgi:hypothetical protein
VKEEGKWSKERRLLSYEGLMTGKRAHISDDLTGVVDNHCADRVTGKTIASSIGFSQIRGRNDCGSPVAEAVSLERPRVGPNTFQAYRLEKSTVRAQYGDSSWNWIPSRDGVSMQKMERSDAPELARSIACSANLTKQIACRVEEHDTLRSFGRHENSAGAKKNACADEVERMPRRSLRATDTRDHCRVKLQARRFVKYEGFRRDNELVLDRYVRAGEESRRNHNREAPPPHDHGDMLPHIRQGSTPP